jgi:hypothetical protein
MNSFQNFQNNQSNWQVGYGAQLNEKLARKLYLQKRLNELSKDIIQSLVGEDVPNLDLRKAEFVALHNELRVLEGKEPRAVAAVEGGEETV